MSGLTANQSVQTDANKKLVSVANTGTGNNVLQTSPVLVTPTLGNATATSITGLTTLNTYSFFYVHGSFTPTFTSWTYNPSDPGPFTTVTPWVGLTTVQAEGRYVRVGPLVTVFITLEVNFNGTGNTSSATLRRIPLVRDLPFRHTIGGISQILPPVTGGGTINWPRNRNQYGDILVPGSTTYENIHPILYTQGYYAPIPGDAYGILYQPSGIIDGKSVAFHCTRKGYNAFNAEIFSQDNYPIENVHFLPGVQYDYLIFNFSLTYYTVD